MQRVTFLTGILSGALLWMPGFAMAQSPGSPAAGTSQTSSLASQAGTQRAANTPAALTTGPNRFAKRTASAGSSVTNLQPFTHTALIPADSDLASVRFQSVKEVRVATSIQSSPDTSYCDELAYRQPVRSMYCPAVEFKGYTNAYQVTYSYEGQPLASDEYGNPYFTFSVYFRPDEIPLAEREAFQEQEGSRSGAAEYFQVTSSRGLQPRTVIDDSHSTFCEGTYYDGAWLRVDPKCDDHVQYKTIMVPSDYITMRVAPSQRN